MDASTVAWYISLLPETAPYDPQIEYTLDHFEVVTKRTFKILVGVLSGIALLAVLFRTIFHVRKKGRLLLDDGLVIFAGTCLAVQTGINYWGADSFFLARALIVHPTLIRTKGEMLAVLETPKISMISAAFSYTANYMIKLSFLTFFRMLIRDLPGKLRLYWKFVLAFTVISWIFSVCSTLIMCPYVGLDAVKCINRSEYLPTVIAVTVLDVGSDVMIASIPIILFRMSQQLRISQKLRILCFLCLNLFIIAFSLVRSIGGRYTAPGSTRVQFSPVWIQLFHHLEAVVAVLMGCITALRSVFGGSANDRSSGRTSLYYRFRKFFRLSSHDDEKQEYSGGKEGKAVLLPGPQTGATLHGLRSFIRRHDREAGHTTVQSVQSDISTTYDPVEEYHNFHRGAYPGNDESNTLDSWSSSKADSSKADSKSPVSTELLPYPEPVARK